MAADITRLRLNLLWHCIGAVLVAYIFYVTLTPHPLAMPGRFTDKIYHFVGYFTVMAWYAQLLSRRRLVMVVFFSMGVGLEFAQLLVNTRSFDWADIVANAAGVVTAAVICRGACVRLLYYFEAWFFAVRLREEE